MRGRYLEKNSLMKNKINSIKTLAPLCCRGQYICYFDTRNKLQHFWEPRSEVVGVRKYKKREKGMEKDKDFPF